jgi:hypothetical protein
MKQLKPVNRNPFLLSLLEDARMLPEHRELPSVATEVEVASVWWNRLVGENGATGLERQHALLEFGRGAVSSPGKALIGDRISGSVLRSLESDRILSRDPGRDVYRFGHDLLEDWILCRVLDQRREDLAEYLTEVGQPLGLIRPMQLLSASVLETSQSADAWTSLVLELEQAPGLAPRWSQAVLTGPLFSTRAHDLLERIEDFLLADDGFRALDLLVAVRTIAVVPDWSMLPLAMKLAKANEDPTSLLLMFA